MEYGQNEAMNDWFWTGGNDVDTEGVFRFVDGSPMQWIHSKWLCSEDSDHPMGGDAFMFAIFNNNPRINSAWCDADPGEERRFICEDWLPLITSPEPTSTTTTTTYNYCEDKCEGSSNGAVGECCSLHYCDCSTYEEVICEGETSFYCDLTNECTDVGTTDCLGNPWCCSLFWRILENFVIK